MRSTGWAGTYSTYLKLITIALLILLVGQTAQAGIPVAVNQDAVMATLETIDLSNVTINSLVIELSNGTYVNKIVVTRNGTVYYVDVTTSSGTVRVASQGKPSLAFAGNILFINDYSVELDFQASNITVTTGGDASGQIFLAGLGQAQPLGVFDSIKTILAKLKGLITPLKSAIDPFVEIVNMIARFFGVIAELLGYVKYTVDVFFKYIVEPGYLHIAIIIWIVGELVLHIASIPQRGVSAIADWFGLWVSRVERLYYFFRSLVDLFLKLLDLVIPT